MQGNDRSPVVVVVVLNHQEDKIPRELEQLARAGVEAEAALSGTVQTENIGFEKIICNVIANPNIRWAVLTGSESEGHLTGGTFKALLANGVDEKMRIAVNDALHPLLFNLLWNPSSVFAHRCRDRPAVQGHPENSTAGSGVLLPGGTGGVRWPRGVLRWRLP